LMLAAELVCIIYFFAAFADTSDKVSTRGK
jgi:hypothetical protein